MLLILLLTAAWTAALVGYDGTRGGQLVSNLGLTLAAMSAGGAAVVRAQRGFGRERRFWRLLGAGLLAWSLGQATWTWIESVLGQEAPFPSLADLGYLGLPPLAAAAMLSLPVSAPTLAGRLRTVLDGLMVAGSLLLISWTVVLHPVFQAGADSRLSEGISLAYPISDVVVITLVAYTWLRARHMSGRRMFVSLPLVGTGLLAFSVADSGFVYLTTTGRYMSGSLLDVGWFLGFMLMLLAAVQPRARGHQHEASTEVTVLPLGNLLPYAAVLLALGTSSVEMLRQGHTDLVVFWLRTITVALLVGRQILLLMENQALTRDLENRVRTRTAELAASQERFRGLVQHSTDMVTVLGLDGVVSYQSQSIERILGYPPVVIQHHSIFDLMEPDEAHLLSEVLARAASEPDRLHTHSATWNHVDGRECRVEITITNLLSDTYVAGLVLNSRDVTDRMLLEEQLTGMAFTDSLTGLPNRALFKDRLEHAMDRRDTGETPLAVLFLDLDGFKSVNDTLGHGFGDDLLVEVAARLRAVVRGGDSVARFGGDEFAVLLEDRSRSPYDIALAERISAVLLEPFDLRGERVHVAASIGIARHDEHAGTADQILRNADLAMYRAKAEGGGGHVMFEPEMHVGLVERVRLETDLRQAVADEQFVVYYQPMISMRTGAITGVEALVRWNHPSRGIVGPDDFIGVAEATGLIRPLGLWVLETACRQVVEWNRSIGGDPLRVSVNVSPRQLRDDDFVAHVQETLLSCGLEPRLLTLEMTESVLIDNREQTLQALTAVHDMGVRVAIDDFGTGYSSLSYLHQFPVDVLKIDRSFIERLANGGDSALVTTILRLGHSLQLETVAEGIERPQEMLMLRRQGCTTGQGFHFSPPMSAELVVELLHGPEVVLAPERQPTG